MTDGSKNVFLRVNRLLTRREIMSDVQWLDLCSAWTDGNLAEAAVQLGEMVEYRNKSQPNPGLRADESPCI